MPRPQSWYRHRDLGAVTGLEVENVISVSVSVLGLEQLGVGQSLLVLNSAFLFLVCLWSFTLEVLNSKPIGYWMSGFTYLLLNLYKNVICVFIILIM